MSDPKTVAAKLTANLRRTFGDELRSVVVFGSVSRGESIPGVSDLNVLALLDSMAVPTLSRAAPLLHDWIRQGNTPPHLYAWDEWEGMRDTFAIEIADMGDVRDVLWGTDPIVAGSVSHTDLRRQTEHDLRHMLLQLRLRLMVNASDPEEVGGLLLAGMPSFTAFMRSALRLGGEAPGLVTRPVIERAAAVIGADPAPMLRCWDSRRSRRNIAVALTDPFVEQYFAFARALLGHIDGVRTQTPAAGSPALPRQGAGRGS